MRARDRGGRPRRRSSTIAGQGTGDARLAIPTPEHYLPLLYALALQAPGDEVALFNDRCVLGSISMTSVLIGASPAS